MIHSLTSITVPMAISVLLVTLFSIAFCSSAHAFAEDEYERTAQQTSANTTNSSSSTNVSIVQGAAALTDKAYQPNPVNIKVGNIITWINHDSTVHTVTEGNPASDSDVPQNGFDSGLLIQGQTFRHSFDKPEIVEYHCSLHPTMLGKIVVHDD